MINTPTPMITKIWVVSVVMEPLLLFVVADRSQSGIGLNIGRILQPIVLCYLFFKFLSGKSFSIPKRGLYFIAPYSSSILYILFATLCSVVVGLYPVSAVLSESRNLIDHLNSFEIRPIIEAFIVVYQFMYFLIFPLLLLRKKADFDFFFKVLFFFLVLHFSLGYLDFFLNIGGFQLIPRHLSDEVFVGLRWHGIAGEPRDAAIYNMSLFFILAVHSIYKCGRVTNINTAFCVILVTSMFLTVSASFVAGVVMAAVLICFFNLYGKSSITLFKYGIIGAIIYMALVFNIQSNDRLLGYYETYKYFLFDVYQNPGIELPYLIEVSFNNIYPVIFLIKDFSQNLNIYSLLFGYGIGGSGTVNANIYGEYYNPNNQFVRIIFEYGVVGSALLIFGIKEFVKRTCCSLDSKSKNLVFLAMFIMFGGILAHRSNVWLIWLGVLGALSSYQHRLNSSRVR